METPLDSRGYHVLRYNSRGVGRSQGRRTLTGFAESQDLKEVVKWMQRRYAMIEHIVLIVSQSLI